MSHLIKYARSDLISGFDLFSIPEAISLARAFKFGTNAAMGMASHISSGFFPIRKITNVTILLI